MPIQPPLAFAGDRLLNRRDQQTAWCPSDIAVGCDAQSRVKRRHQATTTCAIIANQIFNISGIA